MGKLSSIEFRRKIHSIKTKEDLTNCIDYLAQFVKNRLRLKECVDEFLRELEVRLDEPSYTLDTIKVWILTYNNNHSGVILLGGEPESELYSFLHSNYSEINESFHNFYERYIQKIYPIKPLNKNQVSRALNALGLKPVMKKIKISNPNDSSVRRTCIMMICATKEELSEIFRKNYTY
jgi:hypothetical protein